MFATLHGGLPTPTDLDPGSAPPAAIAVVVRAQAGAGLDPVGDGDLWGDPLRRVALALGALETADGRLVASGRSRWERPILVDAWRLAASAARELDPPRSTKVRLPGPYSLARAMAPDPADLGSLPDDLAEALNVEIRALETAGCPLVQVDEPDIVLVGEDERERRRFAGAQRRLLDGVGAHVMLAITGGSADLAGPATVFEAPYASILVDLIAGPDNWKLVRQAPGDRGIVCGVVPGEPERQVDPPVLVWAAQYAAASNRRGLDRVGLATAGSLADLPWAEAERRMRLLAEGAELAAADPETQARRLDPRALARPRRTLGPAVPTPPLDSRGRPPRPPSPLPPPRDGSADDG